MFGAYLGYGTFTPEYSSHAEGPKGTAQSVERRVQQVRVVLRALAAVAVGQRRQRTSHFQRVPLTPQAIRKVGHRTKRAVSNRHCMTSSALAPPAFWTTARKQRIIAMVCSAPPEGRAPGPCDWWPRKR